MLKLAIIGCGRISYKHVQAAIANQKTVVLTGLCDIVLQRTEERVQQYRDACCGGNVEIFDNFISMLDKVDCDLVTICTESGYHAKIAIECMNRGKHVIVEKPMALSIRDANAMIETAERNNVKLCVSHQNRFNPPIQKLRQAVEQGRFGKIIAGNARILWNRGQEYYAQALWRGTYELDGGCLMNQCIHNVDLLQWMLGGEIEWVHGDVGNYIHKYIEAEDYGSIQIKFKNYAIGNVEGTVCVYPKNLEETLTVIGENGIASIGGLAVNKVETWRFADRKDIEEQVKEECNIGIDSVYGNGHILLYKNMLEAIEQNLEPYINGEEGKKALEIILAAYNSSREGRRVYFPLDNVRSIDFK